MARRKKTKLRTINPDPVFRNRLIAKLINVAMRDGKRSVAARQVYHALEIIKEKEGDPISVFSKALENIKPSMEVRPRRIGGAAYQVPMPKESLALRWLVAGARARSNKEYHTFAEKLAAEIMDAASGEGFSVKKKQEVERMAEANRAFAHFRW